jgi:hypothetical protein
MVNITIPTKADARIRDEIPMPAGERGAMLTY